MKFLSQDVASDAEILIENFNTVVGIDLIFAKAMLAKKQNAERPKINNEHHLSLVNARHPLLKVKKVIPNNISFDDYLGIVITGPNTGGKTVLLKTVGLLVLMTKCGLLIPASKESNIMIYDMVCCDIGDEQSITENLSTFSGHMSNIVDIINSITPNSLVLFDEIGGGTDPTEGSNLAISILDYLVNHKVAFIILVLLGNVCYMVLLYGQFDKWFTLNISNIITYILYILWTFSESFRYVIQKYHIQKKFCNLYYTQF